MNFFSFKKNLLSIINKLDYLSNYDLGGGAILEFGYLIQDKKNILFLITSALGGSILFEHIKINFKHNFILIITILFTNGFVLSLYKGGWCHRIFKMNWIRFHENWSL